MSDRQVRFSGSAWQEIEALPEPVRWTVQRVIFHLLEEPVPTLAEASSGATGSSSSFAITAPGRAGAR